jgi:hypothetical protein
MRLEFGKTFAPRFWMTAGAGFSEFVTGKGVRRQIEPVHAFGAGLGIGVTTTSVLNIEIEEVTGGQDLIGRKLHRADARAYNASLSLTRFNRGRPRISLLVAAAGLAHESPVVMLGLRFAALSLGVPKT